MKIPAKGFTHGGKFHADDVFSTALLQIVRPDIQVTRGFVVPDDFDGIVYDVGGGMFDHHQEPRETRPNGVPYAAFGLLWQVLGAQLVGEQLQSAVGLEGRPGRVLLARRAGGQKDFGKRDRRRQRCQPRRRHRAPRLCQHEGRHRGAARLHALEKRPV